MDISLLLVYDPSPWRQAKNAALRASDNDQRLALSTMGFLQYIAPTCMFFLGIYLYHEPFTRAQMAIFLLIWMALAIYSADSILFYRRTYRYGR